MLWRYGLDIIAVAILAPLRQNKKATIASGLRKSLILMVPEAGIEPARRERRGILNAYGQPLKTISYTKTGTYKRGIMRQSAVLCELCGSNVDISAVC